MPCFNITHISKPRFFKVKKKRNQTSASEHCSKIPCQEVHTYHTEMAAKKNSQMQTFPAKCFSLKELAFSAWSVLIDKFITSSISVSKVQPLWPNQTSYLTFFFHAGSYQFLSNFQLSSSSCWMGANLHLFFSDQIYVITKQFKYLSQSKTGALLT